MCTVSVCVCVCVCVCVYTVCVCMCVRMCSVCAVHVSQTMLYTRRRGTSRTHATACSLQSAKQHKRMNVCGASARVEAERELHA
jgi:hypothetical protein